MITKHDAPTETQALINLTEKAVVKMQDKLLQKRDEGYHGWDDSRIRDDLINSLIAHIERAKSDPNQWLDVANLAIMVWNIDEQGA